MNGDGAAAAPRPIVALMQPTFLPWQGYFGLLSAVDDFVFLDDFQFVRRSFMQRNRLFQTGDRWGWVTLPVEHAGGEERATLRDLRPLVDDSWRKKMLGSLKNAYGKAPFFAALAPELEAWLRTDWPTVATLNIAFIELAARWLGYAPRFHRSSELGSTGKRSARLVDLLRRLDARTYYSARGSHGYMVIDQVFPLDTIETHFQRFEPAPYLQRQSSTFVPYLSVLDALLQLGPEETRAVIAAGQRSFTPWHEMPAHAASPSSPESESERIVDDQSH